MSRPYDKTRIPGEALIKAVYPQAKLAAHAPQWDTSMDIVNKLAEAQAKETGK